jgi:predicted DNA-binding ribbon-helix-helix protein
MVGTRLEVRLDEAYRRKLNGIARRQQAPVSAIVREMIDRWLEDEKRDEVRAAVQRMLDTTIDDVPGPDGDLCRELDEARGRYPDLY